MTRRRRRGSTPTRCHHCGTAVLFLTGPPPADWRPFTLRPIDPNTQYATGSYPVTGRRAWRTPELVEELMGRHHIGRAEAHSEVNDLPWHTLHACPPGTRVRGPNEPPAPPRAIDDDTSEGDPCP